MAVSFLAIFLCLSSGVLVVDAFALVPSVGRPVERAVNARSTTRATIQAPSSPIVMLSTSADAVQTDGDSSDDVTEPLKPPAALYIGLLGSLTHLATQFAFPKFMDISRIWLAIFMFSGALLRVDEEKVKQLAWLVPPPLPKRFCVYASGFVELIAGIFLLIPSLKIWGGKLTVLLLLGVYPAHFYSAFSKETQKLMGVPRSAHFVRIFLQLPFLYWAASFVPKW